jgi:hypothetical protein
MSLLGAVREILLILIPAVLLALINDFGGSRNQAGDQVESQAGPREAA